MSSASAIIPPNFDFNNKEPWSPNTFMIIPLQSSQILMPETATVLGVQIYLKMAKLPFNVQERHNAVFISPNGKLPVLKCGAYVVSEMDGVVQLVHSKGAGISDYLNSSERADLRAYISLVNNVLGNALLYFTWVDDIVYNNLTYQRFGSPYNFPLKYLLPSDIRRKIKKQLYSLKWSQMTTEEVYREVDTCLDALDTRLGEGEYFFGNSPTELDALVFGYLYTMLSTSLPNSNQLGNLVKHSPNLVKFCQRIEKEFYSPFQHQHQLQQNQDKENYSNANSHSSSENNKVDQGTGDDE